MIISVFLLTLALTEFFMLWKYSDWLDKQYPWYGDDVDIQTSVINLSMIVMGKWLIAFRILKNSVYGGQQND